MIRSRPAWAALEGAIAGDVVLPGSSDYDLARKPAIPRFHDVRPRAVVRCAAPEDVVETIAFARRSRLATATRSGGHCFAGRSSTPGIVIDVSTMRAVSVAGGVATVGAGARLGDVYDTLDDHGITIPAGCGPSVGIAGLTLGGGLGILGRKHGLTSDHLVGAQVVLADGRVVDRDQHRHDQLFWALRGAGGCNFGVVTCLEFSTIPAPAATSFQLTWRHAQAAPIIDAWLRWAPVGPEELAASLLVTATGDGDEPPVVNLIGAMLGTEAETDALLDELISDAVPEPLSATRRGLSYRQAKRFLAGLGEESSSHGHSFSKSEFFRRPLPGEAVARLVELLAQGRLWASRGSSTSRPGAAPTTA